MSALIESLKGKKTYIVAVLTVIYAITGLATGQISFVMAVTLILPFAGGLSTLRAAIAKIEQAYLQHQATINTVLETVEPLASNVPTTSPNS